MSSYIPGSKGNHKIRIAAVGDSFIGRTFFLTALEKCMYSKDPGPVSGPGNVPARKPRVFENELYDICFSEASVRNSTCNRKKTYLTADVILLVFDLSSPRTFYDVMSKWEPEVKEFASHARTILVGTKSEYWDPRTITPEQINDLCHAIKAFTLVTCSAKTGENVEKILDLAIASKCGIENAG